jgi:hypothetical protein
VTVTKSRWTSLQRFQLQSGLPVGSLARCAPERAASMRLAGLRGPWDTPGASTGRPTSRLENRSSCSLRSQDCGSFGLPRTPSLVVFRASFGLRLAPPASGPSEGPSRTLPRLPRRSVTRSCASSVAFASSSKPPSLPWPIPHGGKPPQLAGRLSWDSSVRPSIDILSSPGPSALPPPGRLGMPLPGQCRSRGFAPPQRIAVPESRRRIAACCRSWGSSRFSACRLATGRIRSPRTTPSPRRTSYPSKNPLADSRTASPRPLHLLWFHRPPGTPRPLSQPDGDTGRPRRSDGLWPTDCSADLHTSTWRSPRRPKSPRVPPGIDRAPLVRPRAATPTLAGESHRTRLDREEWATSGPCSTDEFVPCAPDWIPETTPARFFLGFVPLQGPPASPLRARPTPPPPKRQGHRAPIRRPVDACRARCDQDLQAPGLGGRRHRQAGILDRTRPLRAVPPGRCSRSTGDGIPPRVHRVTACAAIRRSRSLSGAEVGEAGPSFTARFDPCGE